MTTKCNTTLPLEREAFENCEELLNKLNETKILRRSLYPHEFKQDDDTWFVSLTNDAKLAKSKIDEIVLHPRKWICLNDDMDHSDKASLRVVRLIQDFYMHQFPNESQFEYHDDTVNEFLHVDEIILSQHQTRGIAVNRMVVFLVAQSFIIPAFLLILKLRRWFSQPTSRPAHID